MQRLLFLLLMFFALPSTAITVDGMRVWPAPDHTRVVFELSQATTHKLFTLSNPDRVVIDIQNASLNTNPAALDLNQTGITAVRTGQQSNKALRVVLDLDTNLKPRSFVLKPNQEYGNRLVIDLQRPSATTQIIQSAEPRETISTSQLNTGKRDLIIAIDAGHGGEDPGAAGPRRTKEKHIVLAIARELNQLLEDEPGYKPVMIRTGDYYISLARRRQIAREHNADLFVSIHADAFTNPSARGVSVYALSLKGATSATAKYLADKENATDIIGGVGGVSLDDKDEVLRSVLVDLSMTATLSSSLQLGDHVLKYMSQIARLHKVQVEQAGFAVLKSPDIPSILVETGFISNPSEEKNLGSRAYRKKLAQAVFFGVKQYFDQNPQPGTWVAWNKNRGSEFISYKVARGDTLSDIAKRYRISVSQIRALNNLPNNTIRIGQVLKLPDV